jgi:hypothetical protein
MPVTGGRVAARDAATPSWTCDHQNPCSMAGRQMDHDSGVGTPGIASPMLTRVHREAGWRSSS